jgi:methanethiol S-methyltransferase
MLGSVTQIAYRATCYGMFLGTFIYAVGFVDDLLISHSMDAPPAGDVLLNLRVDMVLILCVAVFHRVAELVWSRKLLPARVCNTFLLFNKCGRCTRLLAASAALFVVIVMWRPLGGSIWSVEGVGLSLLLYGLCALGWILVLAGAVLSGHGGSAAGQKVIYFGVVFALWATPTMTLTHLIVAIVAVCHGGLSSMGARKPPQVRGECAASGDPSRAFRARRVQSIAYR